MVGFHPSEGSCMTRKTKNSFPVWLLHISIGKLRIAAPMPGIQKPRSAKSWLCCGLGSGRGEDPPIWMTWQGKALLAEKLKKEKEYVKTEGGGQWEGPNRRRKSKDGKAAYVKWLAHGLDNNARNQADFWSTREVTKWPSRLRSWAPCWSFARPVGDGQGNRTKPFPPTEGWWFYPFPGHLDLSIDLISSPYWEKREQHARMQVFAWDPGFWIFWNLERWVWEQNSTGFSRAKALSVAQNSYRSL